MTRPLRDQALALAGIAQAARLANQIARTGEAESSALRASIDSLFVFDADSTEAVYGGVDGVRTGLAALAELLGRNLDAHQQDQLRYIMGLLYLERKLAVRTDMLGLIRQRLEHARRHADHFADSLDQLLPALAGIYQDTLSSFRFRIQVTGDPRVLETPTNANRIRAVLLAGIRSARLWHQLGGRRWKLLFQRPALLREIARLQRDG